MRWEGWTRNDREEFKIRCIKLGRVGVMNIHENTECSGKKTHNNF